MTMIDRRLPALLILLMAQATPFVAHAQSNGQWCVKAGGIYTVMRDPLGLEHGPQTGRSVGGPGWMIGGGWELRTPSQVGIHLELLFAAGSTGYRFDEGNKGYPERVLLDGYDHGRRTMRTVELQLPVLLTSRRWQGLRLNGGVLLGRLLQATDIRRGTRNMAGEETELDERTDASRSLASWSLSAALGFLVEGPHGLHFETRYLHGLTDLDAPSGMGPSYARQVQVGLVYVPGRART